MSQKDVELVRARFESFARTGGTGVFDLEYYDPDVRWHLRQDLPDAETLVGLDRVRQFFSQWAVVFEDSRIDVEELIDADDRVIAVLRIRGRIKGGDEEVDMPETWVIRLVDGKTVETWEYSTKAEALKAVGLAE